MKYELYVQDVVNDLGKVVSSLRASKKLPKHYVYDYKRMDKILKDELLNNTQKYNSSDKQTAGCTLNLHFKAQSSSS